MALLLAEEVADAGGHLGGGPVLLDLAALLGLLRRSLWKRMQFSTAPLEAATH